MSEEAEIAAALAQLREQVTGGAEARSNGPSARQEAELYWPVNAERPSGTGLRAIALAPPKGLLRRLARWYVEPALADQRRFNAAVLRVLDELEDRLRRLERPT